MARASSKNAGKAGTRSGNAPDSDPQDVTAETASTAADTTAPGVDSDTTEETWTAITAEGRDTPEVSDTPVEDATTSDSPGAYGDDSLDGATMAQDGETPPSEDMSDTRAVEEAEVIADSAPADSTIVDSAPTAAPPPVPAPAEPARGGLVPLVLGGVIAAGIGYGAAYMGWLPTAGQDGPQIAEFEETMGQQAAELEALRAQIDALAAAEPAAPPEIDFSPVLAEIAALSDRLDASADSLTELADRVAVLEDRPVFTGSVDGDAAAAMEAATALEAELTAEREAAATRAAELEAEAAAAAEAAEQAAAEAEAAIAAAQAEAEATAARAATEAALVQLRAAFDTGAPFADPLQTVAATIEPPAELAAQADSGVPTLDALQAAFPPLARDALPVALQETAGDGVTDRLGAFVRGQVGGRSVEPREGSDPDAVLSRVEAAVRAGDLSTALEEVAALPEGAQAVLAPWVADVQARAAAEDGLAALTDAVSASGN